MKSLWAWVFCLAAAVCAAQGIVEAAAVKEGDAAPDVAGVTDETGKAVKLADYKGKGIIVFFYPKADTPGCTAESCGFRDISKDFDTKGYVLLGASRDTPEAQKAFKEKYKLPYNLLSDPKAELAGAFGFGPGARSTAIIGKDGKVEKLMKGGTANHAKEVLGLLK